MRSILSLLFLVPALVLASSGLAQHSFAQQKAGQSGWVELFNGENLEGWIQKGGKAKYEVKDGTIVGTTVPNTPNSFLCTERNYGDFELQLEFKVHPDLNSGIQIRSIGDPNIKDGRVHGYQVEIDPSIRSWSCGIYDEARRGWLNDLSTNAAARYAFRQNDWNHYRILAVGDSIQTWINGVYAANLKDDMTAEGLIALQVHGVGGRKDPLDVVWRNVRLREIVDGEVSHDSARETDEADVRGKPQKVAEGFKFAEGPEPGPDGKIYFTDIPNRKIHAFDPQTGETTEHRSDSGGANGLAWTPNDQLIACEGSERRISIQSWDGTVTTIVDQFDGKRLNSPNDLTLDGVGGLYFSDPRFGQQDDLQMDVRGVYYVDRGRKITRLIDDLEQPNGIELSNDGKTLYVADYKAAKVFAYDVKGPGKIEGKREFASLACDGMSIDENDNLYFTSGNAVHIHGKDGAAKNKIEFPENPTNVTFGGSQNQTLFVTCPSALYSMSTSPVSGGRAFANPELPK